jgi:uncharacterized membrane protein YbhN (UPF0104 family)
LNEVVKRTFSGFFSILVIGGLGYYIWKNREAFHATLNASWYHIGGLTFFILMTWLINCLQSHLLLRNLGIKIGFRENLVLQMATILANNLPMRVGTILRMRYFNKLYGLAYSRFIGLTGVRVSLILFYSAVFSSIGLIGLNLSKYSWIWVILGSLVALIFVISGFGLITLIQRVEVKNQFIKKQISGFFAVFEMLKTRPTLFWQLSALILLHFVTLALRFGISFDCIHVKFSPWSLFILAPMTTLVSFVSITPGNLGLREWMIGFFSLASGIDFDSGIFAGTIDRAILMICTFLFGSIPLVYIWIKSMRPNSSPFPGDGPIE